MQTSWKCIFPAGLGITISLGILMYQDFFSLKEQPFSISPDPDFLFLSERHKEALAHLTYGLQGNGGFVLLTGEVGTGKTTVCRALLKDLPQEVDVAFILNPALTEIELLATICDEFKIAYQQDKMSLKSLFDALTSWMMSNLLSGRSAIVLIDEAQHLSFSVLEQLRLLTNIESNNKKPLQVILIGQTELQQKLKQTELRQLAQRITARYHLLALTQKETEFYVQHRLNVAGASYPLFEAGLLRKIFKYSQGIPRLINLICDRSMLCAYSENSLKITAKMLKQAAQEIDLSKSVNNEPSSLKQWWRFSFLVFLLLLSGWKMPQILNNLQLIQQTEVIESTPATVEISEKEQSITEPEELPWFDAYPQLDFSRSEFTDALTTLYAVWGYQTDGQRASCEGGKSASLLCFSTKSNIQKLKLLNYPAVIKLDYSGQYVYAVIYKIAGDYQLIIADQTIKVSEAWLRRYWNGGLTLLWKTPFIANEVLKFGSQNRQVVWLNNQLNKIYYKPQSSKSRFDLQLLSQVKQFQLDNNLHDDGIVGARTLMLLMQQLNPQFPRLIEE